MLVGICSDTHGQVATMRRALAIFDRQGVERIIHCGDVGGEAVFDQLVGREVRFVWGNTDVVTAGLLAYLQTVGLPVPQSIPMVLEWAGRRIGVFHGHERGFSEAPQTMKLDYLLHGHTHQRRDERIGSVRVINAGALHRARIKTVATLNLANDQLTSYVVPPA